MIYDIIKKLWMPEEVEMTFIVLKQKDFQLKILYLVKLSFKNEGKHKAILGQKQRGFSTNRLAL